MTPRWRLACLALGYLFYLFLGGTVFSAIEHPIERRMLEVLRSERKAFLAKHSYSGVNAKDLDDYIASVVSSSRRGVTLVDENIPNWSFGQSFFFSATVITTIGYGQQTPLSPLGKMFCLVYSSLGIPLTLLLLSSLLSWAMAPVSSLLSHLNSRLGHQHSPFRIRLLHLVLVSSIIVVVFLLLPASILDTLEPSWTWFDSFYYCFISLSTVGLGDFIPGDEPGQSARSLYKSLIALYLVLGVAAVMLAVRLFSAIPELDVSAWFLDEAHMEDPERQRLQESGVAHSYTQHVETEAKETSEQRRVVRARSRRDDSDECGEGPLDDNSRVH